MAKEETGFKPKSRLAVFEHVVQKTQKRKRRNFPSNRYIDDDSPSESELVIDDLAYDEDVEDTKTIKKRPLTTARIRNTEEILSLQCEWNSCNKIFGSYEDFNNHLKNHATSCNCESDGYNCLWNNCPTPNQSTLPLLIRHVSYHGYLSKLKNIGENVLTRNNLPDCKQEEQYVIAINSAGYTCEWDFCSFTFNTIYDFLIHVLMHIKSNPTGKGSSANEIIQCEWNGCGTRFSTQYKLQEHVRVHTKEKMVACPTCFTLFSNKTRFCDHRKRQLKESLRNYQCSQCLKLFPSERLLSDHMRSHINQYKCTMCDMTCAKPSILAKHIRYRHLNERPFKCPNCSKTFVAKNNLKTHLMTHEDKPMKCDKCDFGCKSKVGLENHYSKCHDKIKVRYQCHVCKNKYFRGDTLTKHLIKLHKFHWPSGHSRFRYRRDQDGICRLQTVRYESLEVTEEMIRSESMPPSKSATLAYDISYTESEKLEYKLTVVGNEEKSYSISIPEVEQLRKSQPQNYNVLITIEDIDEHGNVLNTQVVESSEILLENESCGVSGVNVISENKSGNKNNVSKEEICVEKDIINNDKDIHYFSKEVIMNYDKFKIEHPTNET